MQAGAVGRNETVAASGTSGMVGRLLATVESRAAMALAALIVLYTAAFTGLNLHRLVALRQGFDFLVYHQPIWNTVRGRPFAQSMYAFAPTHLGVDLVLFELWIAPFYALWPSPTCLFLLISLGAGLGALPLFLLARDRTGAALAGLGWAALYLVFLPVGAITLSEFQPRLFAATALLGAVWFARRQRPVAFWLCLLLALSVRSDVGLVVGCLGLYFLTERRSWAYGLAPALAGFGYWAAAVFLIVPALADGHGFLWQVNYAWLGASSGAIVRRILTDPLYVAGGVLTLEKGRYLAQLLWPLAFLPLLRPRLLLIPAPILALNLLSEEPVQFDLFHQYQALIVPFLFLAALEGLADLHGADSANRLLRHLGVLLAAAIVAAALLLPTWPGDAASRNGLHPGAAFLLVPLTLLAILAAPLGLAALFARSTPGGPRPAARDPRSIVPALGVLLGLMLLQHLALGQGSGPLQFLKRPGPSADLPAARRIIARVPTDAPLAVTSQLGPHVPLRQELYYFPGNDSYDPALVERARFVIGDRRREDGAEERAIRRLVESGRWGVVAEEGRFVLLERARP